MAIVGALVSHKWTSEILENPLALIGVLVIVGLFALIPYYIALGVNWYSPRARLWLNVVLATILLSTDTSAGFLVCILIVYLLNVEPEVRRLFGDRLE